MKPALLAVLALLPLLTPPSARAADELRVVYPAGSTVVFEESVWHTLEGKEATREINGQDASDTLEGLDSSERVDKVIRFTTWLDEVKDGRPVGARRRFDELTQTAGEVEEEGVLAGRTVLLSANVGGDKVSASLPDDDEGPEVHEVYLSNHRLSFELDRYLREGAVQIDDTWELDEAAVRESLNLDRQDPRYFESDNSESELMDREMREAFEVSGSVEYERREEVDGVACAVLLITFSAELSDADVDTSAHGKREGVKTAVKLSMRMEQEEHLWFALEAGRPVRSQGEWAGEITWVTAESSDDTGIDVVTRVMDIRGGFEQCWSFEEER